ncbi:MAG TPA: ATP-binding protein [Labilithrix sp.]|nr:ATP-binding protein [Labilithrix sp.]
MVERADELVTTENVLRAVLESPRDIVIFALDRQYRYLAFNEAHRRTIQAIWEVDIAVGQKMLDIIGREDDRQRAKANFDRALAGEHFIVIEEYGEEALSRRYYEDVYSPIIGADGAVLGLTLFLTDITEQKRTADQLEEYRVRLETLVAERTVALRRSEALYRTLVLNAPVAVIVHRGDELLYVNPAAVALCGERDADALLGRRLGDIVHPASEAVAGASRVELAIEPAPGGRIEVEWTSIGVEFEGAGATLSLAVDISSRKRAEAERRRLEEQIRETQKLESLGLLAGGIAHDFNNLLVGILGNADLALRGVRSGRADGDVLVQLQRIKTAAIRAAELTGQMLAYSGKGPFVIRAIDLSELTREMADLASVSVPKGAHLVLDLAPDLPAFEGDSAQIRQIVLNLITNAADALGDAEGTITLRTSVLTADRGLLSSTYVDDALPAGRYLCLEVSDTGIGMDETTRKRLFDPFFTTKARGRGLGLAAVVGIVRAHEGAITVTSELGRGSTFRVYLPCSEQAAVVPAAPFKPEEWRASGTVLIADDEPRVRQVLAMMLADIGFTVLEASSAPACLELYRAHADTIDAVMVDLKMPGGGGREVVRVLRAEGHRVPVVVSSGYSEEAVGPDLRADPRLAFLEKPFEYATFVRTLKSAIESV